MMHQVVGQGAFRIDEVLNFCPAIAVPTTVKMPEPITAPMPSPVSDHGPSVFLSRCSGSSESEISLSMDLHAKTWFARVMLPGVVESVPPNSNRNSGAEQVEGRFTTEDTEVTENLEIVITTETQRKEVLLSETLGMRQLRRLRLA